MRTEYVQHLKHILLVSAVCLLGGCGTPKPVLNLATDTGVHVSQVATRLSGFVDAQTTLAQLRSENLAATLRQYGEVEYAQARRVEAMRLGGEAAKVALYENLVATSEKLYQMKSAIPVAVQKQRNLALASQQGLDAPIKDLNSISQSLAALGKEMSLKAWVAYYAEFGDKVGEIIRQKQKAIDDVKQKAQSTNQQLKQKATPQKKTEGEH